MLKKKLEIFLRAYNLKYYIFIILIFGSLNINPGFIFQNDINFIYLINITRLISPFIFFLLFFNWKISFSDNIFKIIVIYILFSFFSSFTILNESLFSSNHYYYILFLTLILGLNEIHHVCSYEKYLKLYIYVFIFIIVIFLFYLINLLITDIDYFFGLRGHPSLFPSERILDQAIIRSTGFSRITILIFIFFLGSLLYNNSLNLVKILFLFFLSIIIHSLYSRTSLYFLYLLSFPFLFFEFLSFKKNFFYRLKAWLLIFFIPFLIYQNLHYLSLTEKTSEIVSNKNDFEINSKNKKPTSNKDNSNKDNSNKDNFDKGENKSTEDKFEKKQEFFKKPNKRELASVSGRDYFWKKTLDLSNKEYLIGGGFQYDRHLFEISISNGFLYSLLSAGLIGVIVYLYIIIKFLKIIFYTLKKKKYDEYSFSSIVIISFLILRSFVETSFMFFGFDLVLILLCYIILAKKIKVQIG